MAQAQTLQSQINKIIEKLEHCRDMVVDKRHCVVMTLLEAIEFPENKILMIKSSKNKIASVTMIPYYSEIGSSTLNIINISCDDYRDEIIVSNNINIKKIGENEEPVSRCVFEKYAINPENTDEDAVFVMRTVEITGKLYCIVTYYYYAKIKKWFKIMFPIRQ